jgi:hypothetical protein
MRLSVFPHLEQKSANLRCLLRSAIEPRGAIKESCNRRGGAMTLNQRLDVRVIA